MNARLARCRCKLRFVTALAAPLALGCGSSTSATTSDAGHHDGAVTHDSGHPRDAGHPVDAHHAADAARDHDVVTSDSGPTDGGGATDAPSHHDGDLLRGAFANPDGSGMPADLESNTEKLESVVGHLDLELDYHPFATPFPTADESAAMAHGRIPVISLGCGATNRDIASGGKDATLQALAAAMKAAGKPVVLRWFWEMNLASSANGRGACFNDASDGKDAESPDFFNPADYIAAWQHIHNVVREAGADNVSMFFCGSGGTPETMPKYYPGDDYVEMNGFDVYDRVAGQSFHDTLAPAYAAALDASSARPIWVGETGAMHAQQTLGYIDGQTAAMLRASFPKIQAVTYFDAVGPAGNWSFNAAGLAGFAAFE